jgi:hypothetical protein
MQIYFPTRKALRDFSKGKTQSKPVDNGSHAPQGKRWAAEVKRNKG